MELNASIIAMDTKEDGNLLWMDIFCIMGTFQAIIKERIVIRKMVIIVNKYFLIYFNKMLVFVFQIIILIVFKIKDLFATPHLEQIIVEYKIILKIVILLISKHA